jgi:hypothetical protein
MLDRPLRQRRDETAESLREAPHDGVREGHGALETRSAHELDRVVDDGVLCLVGERELVGAETQRRAHRRVELAHRALAQPVDPEVERARALHRSVRQPLGQRAVTLVESFHGRAECAVGVCVLLEDAAHDLVRGAARWGDHRTPRTNSS